MTVPEEVQAAAAAFGLALDSASKLSGGRINPTWLLGPPPSVLRCYCPERIALGMRPLASIAWEHALLKGAAAAGLPVIPPVPTAQGQTLITTGHGWWAHFHFRPGRPLSTLADAEDSIDLLARFHRALAGPHIGPLARQRPGVGERLALGQRYLGAAPQLPLSAVCAHLAQRSSDLPGAAAITAFLPTFLRGLELLRQAREDPAVAVLPRQPTHGDWNPSNLARAESGDLVLYDLDECALDLPLLDVAHALRGLRWYSKLGSEEPLAGPLMAGWLRRYHAQDPIPSVLAPHLPACFAAGPLFYLAHNFAEQIRLPEEDRSWCIQVFGTQLAAMLAEVDALRQLARQIFGA